MADKAVILLSGGLDSATVLAIATKAGHQCYAISFDYGQRHRCELNAAKQIASSQSVVEHKIFTLNLNEFGGSALTDISIDVPKTQTPETSTDKSGTTEIPITYVPARNTIFLSIALGWAEVIKARYIYLGVNAVDYSGYPDCRPEYIDAYSKMANLATKAGLQGEEISIQTPLIQLTKAQIIKTGSDMGIDYSKTISCYDPTQSGAACGACESCRLRAEGFKTARITDNTVYK
jgi:7-cyano-7-deazaguanine synthase